MPEENVFAKPARLSWEEAAAFPLAALTAYRALFSRGGLQAAARPCSCSAPAAASRRSPCSSPRRRVRACSSRRRRPRRSSGRRRSAPRAASSTRRSDWVAAAKELAAGRRPRDRLGRLDVAASRSTASRPAAASSSSAPPAAPRRRCTCGRSTSASSRCSGRRWAARATSRALLRLLEAGALAAGDRLGRPLAEAEAALDAAGVGAALRQAGVDRMMRARRAGLATVPGAFLVRAP